MSFELKNLCLHKTIMKNWIKREIFFDCFIMFIQSSYYVVVVFNRTFFRYYPHTIYSITR